MDYYTNHTPLKNCFKAYISNDFKMFRYSLGDIWIWGLLAGRSYRYCIQKFYNNHSWICTLFIFLCLQLYPQKKNSYIRNAGGKWNWIFFPSFLRHFQLTTKINKLSHCLTGPQNVNDSQLNLCIADCYHKCRTYNHSWKCTRIE